MEQSPLSNFERMLLLAETVFDVRNDPDQLDVDQNVLEKLEAIHPASVSEENYGDGPVAWVLLIPTSYELMQRFLSGDLTEKQLFEQTCPGDNYDALYLCSAMVLDEYRRKGIAERLAVEAIKAIRQNHPIKTLFVWPFTAEGQKLAVKLSVETGLTLLSK